MDLERNVSALYVANLIPTKHFVTKGSGETSLGYHPGAFDIAMERAGIENYNLVPYSSILPADCET